MKMGLHYNLFAFGLLTEIGFRATFAPRRPFNQIAVQYLNREGDAREKKETFFNKGQSTAKVSLDPQKARTFPRKRLCPGDPVSISV